MKKLLIIAALLLSTGLNSFAQEQESLFSVVHPDSLDVLLKNYLNQTTGKRFEDPKLPRFLIGDRNDIFVFGIGGYVGAKMIYDYQGNSTVEFRPVQQVIDPKINDVLSIDMTSSRFFFKILGNTKKGIIEAYMEAGFSGAGKTLSLKKAYVNALGFRVGINNTAFADNQTVPIITDGGSNSFNDRSVPLIEYSYLFKNGLRVQGGFEFPQSTTIYYSKAQAAKREVVNVEMPMPDVVAGTFYDKNNLHLHAGGIFRLMQFYDEFFSKRFLKMPGYGVNLSGNYTINSSKSLSHKIYLQGQYEYMMSDCFSTIDKMGLSAIMPNRIGWTEFDLTRGFGGQIGYTLSFGPNRFNLQTCYNRIYGHENSGFPDLYKSGLRATVNYMRTIFKYGTIGLECDYGFNKNVGGDLLNGYRGMALLRYDF